MAAFIPAHVNDTPAAMLARLVLTKLMPATMEAFLSLLAASSWSGPCPDDTANTLHYYVRSKLPLVEVAEPESAMQLLIRGLVQGADCACRKAVLAALLGVSCSSGLFATLQHSTGSAATLKHSTGSAAFDWEAVPYLIPTEANGAAPRVWLHRTSVTLLRKQGNFSQKLRLPGSAARSAHVHFEGSPRRCRTAPVRVGIAGLGDKQSCAVTCCVFEAGDGHAQLYKTLLHSPVRPSHLVRPSHRPTKSPGPTESPGGTRRRPQRRRRPALASTLLQASAAERRSSDRAMARVGRTQGMAQKRGHLPMRQIARSWLHSAPASADTRLLRTL